MKNCIVKRLDHGIVLVGWGISDEGEKYWKVRNSWGQRWGNGGYAQISMDDAACGLLQDGDQVWTKVVA
jgi:C1A family cysteine protease